MKDISPGESSFPSNLTNVGGTLFFRADDSANGYELWRSDGTTGGTVLVADIRLGTESSRPAALTNVRGTLFFGADDGIHGIELWTGTTAIDFPRTRQLRTAHDDPAEDSTPDWSPAGLKIAYDVAPAGVRSRDIFLMDAVGKGRVQKTPTTITTRSIRQMTDVTRGCKGVRYHPVLMGASSFA